MFGEEYRVPAAGAAAAASALWVYRPADFAEWGPADHVGCGPGDHIGCGPAGLAGWGQAGYARSGLSRDRDVHALGGCGPAATDVPLLLSRTNSLARDLSALTLAAAAPENASKCSSLVYVFHPVVLAQTFALFILNYLMKYSQFRYSIICCRRRAKMVSRSTHLILFFNELIEVKCGNIDWCTPISITFRTFRLITP